MAAACQEFPSESLLQELISSFPREWQGLFAAVNVKESLAVHSGAKWLRDNSSSLQKNCISPHWPDLIRSLCLLFPVVLDKRVVFQPKFACFTLKLQRNMLCFIVYHSESIPVDDLKVFVSMLAKLPQMNKSWFAVLVSILQTKMNNKETENTDTRSVEPRSFDLKDNKTRTVKISACCISESNKTRLNNLCSRIKGTSTASSSLLTAKLERITASPSKAQSNAAEADMEIDDVIQSEVSEVIEISDDSPEMSPCGYMEIPNPPVSVLSVLVKPMDITIHSPVISPTRHTSEVPEAPDNSTLCETKEIPGNPLIVSRTMPSSDVPELEIINMEVKSSEEDAFLAKYTSFKNHLRSLEDLDVELFQEFLNCFLENTPKYLVKICKFLEISTIPESSTIMLIKQFLLLEKECSFQATVIFAEHSIGLCTLQQAGSRNLLAAVVAFAQKHPKAFVDGVMVKLFNTTYFLWPQCDLIVKVVKNFQKETLLYFMEKLLQSNEKDSFSLWNEHMILLLSTVLDRRLDLDVSHFENFVNWLQFQSLSLASSLKFAKLVFTIINKYGSLVKPRLPTFKQILEENNTFLKKSGLTALKKLED